MNQGPGIEPAAAESRWGWLRQAENLLLIVPLLAMMLLPVVEILLRWLFHTGISGSSTIVQHLTLVVGMVGGAVAAREGRLLALSPAQTLFKGRTKAAARIFSSGFAAAISGFLCVDSVQYVLEVRPLGKILVYGLPVWAVQLILPAGFGVVACRLLWHASARWRGRGLALGVGLVATGLALWAPGAPERWLVPALVALAVATFLGAPIFTALGGAALILFWAHGEPIQSVPLKHYSLTTNDLLPSIPIFTLAGFFMAFTESGKKKR